MDRMRIKLIVAGVLLAGAVGYLALAGMDKGWVYYIDVDMLLSDVKYQQTRVRLCGRVAEDNFQSSPARLTASFELIGPSERVPVAYQGVIPELFKPGGEVVLEGRLDEAGVFQADVLMTKCASKYQAEEHAKKLEAGHDR